MDIHAASETQDPTQPTPVSRTALWAGRVISALVILFLLFDAAMKLVPLTIVTETMAELGYPADLARVLGILTLLCTILYAIPRTSVLGAILLTGFLGGAIATHLRVGSPIFTHVLFGAYLSVMVWVGLFLRDQGLRALIPLRRGPSRSS